MAAQKVSRTINHITVMIRCVYFLVARRRALIGKGRLLRRGRLLLFFLLLIVATRSDILDLAIYI